MCNPPPLSAPDRKYGDAESASCAPSARREERRVPGRYASDEQRRDRDAGAFERHRNYRRGHKLRSPVELRDPEGVARPRDGLPPTEDAIRLASVLGLLADPVRSQSRKWA